jgi:hypothetical protein
MIVKVIVEYIGITLAPFVTSYKNLTQEKGGSIVWIHDNQVAMKQFQVWKFCGTRWVQLHLVFPNFRELLSSTNYFVWERLKRIGK